MGEWLVGLVRGLGRLGLVSMRWGLLILWVIRLVVGSTGALLVGVWGSVSIHWGLLVLAFMHKGMRRHPVYLLGVRGIHWSRLLDRSHLLILQWRILVKVSRSFRLDSLFSLFSLFSLHCGAVRKERGI